MGKQSKGLSIRLSKNDGYLLRKSSKEDALCAKAVLNVIKKIQSLKEFENIQIYNTHKILNKDIVESLIKKYPNVKFGKPLEKTGMMPDGGVTFIKDLNGVSYPILIVEMKSQGTNDERKKKGLSEQARGNAIERLGKNVIGFRTFLADEGIMPFVCFGDGCDFDKESKSTIIDRVLIISMYGELNNDQTKANGIFNRGSFYFRKEPWTLKEIEEILLKVAKCSIYHYFSKYTKEAFIKE